MTSSRWLLATLLSVAWLAGLGASPAGACTCFGREAFSEQVANGDSTYVAFHGSVLDSGDSNVTALWASDPPQPGLALLFEVSDVREGEVGSTVVVHTPGGPPGSGDCSVGVLAGEQFVIASRGADGHLTAGSCGIFPGVSGGTASEYESLFGPARAPDPNLAAASLSDPATRPPDPDEPGATERYEELDGTTATPVIQDERPQSQVWLLSGIFLAATLTIIAFRVRGSSLKSS